MRPMRWRATRAQVIRHVILKLPCGDIHRLAYPESASAGPPRRAKWWPPIVASGFMVPECRRYLRQRYRSLMGSSSIGGLRLSPSISMMPATSKGAHSLEGKV